MPFEFVTQIIALQYYSRKAADAASLPGVTTREWMLPEYDDAFVGYDLQDPIFLRGALTRIELTQAYVGSLQRDPECGCGAAGELIAFKSGIDYLGACERALHARHASRSRALRWAAARRRGHGDTVYGSFASVLNDLNNTIGASAPVPGV